MKLLKKNKKAQIELSFHWIFILIAGAAILAFFFMITKSETKDSTDQLSVSIGKRLDSLFSTIQQSPDSVQLQDSLNSQLNFKCAIDGHSYSLKDSTKVFYLYSQIIFSPKIVGESKIITWTKTYYSPYPVTQILYLTDEKTKYIFSSSMNLAYDMMPDLFVKENVNIGELAQITDDGFRKYVIVVKEGETFTLSSSIKKKSTIIYVSSQTKQVRFVNPNELGEGTLKPYVDDTTLFGAIISADSELYGCTMQKLMDTSRIVGEINLKRVSYFTSELQTNNKCLYFYGSSVPQEYLENIIKNSVYNTTISSYSELNKNIDNMKILNNQMAIANCPTIY